ncbi:MAG: enoyl-CoA hydratase/isomerase family protein [Pseudolabrys sp.]|nr:enoyl-CoA hydratase/isomerase family protein [Pseudolabrys sp.]
MTSDNNGVRHLTLCRPEARNSLNHDLMRTLCDYLCEADVAPGVRVIVLRGEGKGFCAGADLKATAILADEAAVRAHAALMRQLLDLPPTLGKPVIAQVHGFALGAGLALALACDVAICTESAILGYPEARHGILPALVMPSLLRLVGAKVTFDMLATGRLIDGKAAHELGFARSVPDDDVEKAASEYAADLSSRPDDFVRLLKQLMRNATGLSPKAAMAAAEQANIESRLRRLPI